MCKKLLTVALVAVTLGVFTTPALGLSGLSATGWGANGSLVVACDFDGVSASYTNVYDATAGTYVITAVSLGGIHPSCEARTYHITLANEVTAIQELVGTIALDDGTHLVVPLIPTVDSQMIHGVTVVISG